jgi:hypothetical protein
MRAELAQHELAVEHIHLAAEGFKIQLSGHLNLILSPGGARWR